MVREFHPAADLFPLLAGEAFQALVADIRQNGLREPILVDCEGRILDGRNRYRACHVAKVEPRFVQWDGQGTIPEVVLSLNLHRRHLSESQRAMVAARAARFLEREAAARRGMRTDLVANLQRGSFGRSVAKAGGQVNVSTRLVSHASKVLRNGCDKLIALVDSGELAVSAAARLASLGHESQEKALDERAREIAERRGRRPMPGKAVAPPSLGAFGVLGKEADKDRMLLWVEPRALSLVIQTLKRRGLRCVGRSPEAASLC